MVIVISMTVAAGGINYTQGSVVPGVVKGHSCPSALQTKGLSPSFVRFPKQAAVPCAVQAMALEG